ncbi:hypothetical protein CLV33_107242 [Jejuia pallidilutea]|uniref:Uncharacterized protein n=1 Tax=Jejuia pallidilutea TaxID=504487 RepID=A0A362WZ43_9FLAO|nr:hypothetical protein [Jejuia pallidilutea]PQV47453.1 hypothetical protein CLV33_107242 [Jejuia pallidilutea]
MNLVEFIFYLKNPSKIEEFVTNENQEIDIDYADIYLENELSIYSKLFFFDAEQIDGKLEIEFNGKKYVNLFPLDYLLDIFTEFNVSGDSDLEIANKILNYRINDA